MRSLLPLALGPVLLLTASTSPSAGVPPAPQDSPPSAPDGRPGLGTTGTARELARGVASPTPAQAEMLRELNELEPDIRILAEMARRSYRDRGYFRILGTFAEQGLDELHARYLEIEPVALALLGEGGEVADAFAEMFLDLRFAARTRLLEPFAGEVRDLQRGLALLRASVDGYVELKDIEARAIAGRVDLAASLLRAIRLDLEVLRERGDSRAPGAPDPAWMAELVGLTKMRSDTERRAAFDRLKKKLAFRQERLDSVLFTPRLVEKLKIELDRRTLGAENAAKYAEEVRLYLLELPEGEQAPREITRMAKQDRYRAALTAALQGLGGDPLDEELTYRVGQTTEFLYRIEESRQWYDRYLALRGIRPQQHRTLRNRELTEWEEHALMIVTLAAGPVPGGG